MLRSRTKEHIVLTLTGNWLLQTGPALGRRSFLSLGGLLPLGLSLDVLLQARRAQAAEARRDTAVILLFMAGGPSHIDMYDPKPSQPEEVRGPFRFQSTNVPGFAVCELMPCHSQVADRLSLIRSLTHDLAVHDDATHWVQTGYPLLNARQRGQQNPSQGSVVARLRGANQPDMPPYVCIPEDYRRHAGFYEHAAYLGARYNALDAGGDPSLGNFRAPDFAPPDGMSNQRISSRRELLAALQRGFGGEARYAELEDVQREAFELTCGSRARRAFALDEEPERVRDRYGRHAYGQGALLARRLIEAGVTFVTLNLYEKDVDWWDDHYTIEKNLRARLPRYDQALCALVSDLAERGLSERVLVAAFGEFGRAPRIDANAGRGHWPKAMHAVLSGGGLRGGQIVGATTRDGGEPAERPLAIGDLLATIYRVLGIDPRQTLPDRQGRPIALLPAGAPIHELL